MLHSRPRPLGFIEPCQPTTALKPPIGAGWIHEIKHDGYRMMAQRAGERVRLITRNGYDWSERYPAVVKGDRPARGEIVPDRRRARGLRRARARGFQPLAPRPPSE